MTTLGKRVGTYFLRPILVVAAGALLLATPGTAKAYPTTAVFTPTGEALDGGAVCVFAYSSTNFAPRLSPGAWWLGSQVGVIPQFQYGKGLRFGGLELGFDVISPFGNNIVKPVLNAKVGLITEGTVSPAIALGIMEVSPALPAMNLIYLSVTKTLRMGEGPSFGRLTLAFGYAAGARAQFNGTFPFYDTRVALMAAYETPEIAQRLGFVIDHFGGTSEVSNTYMGATLHLLAATKLAAGAFIASERSEPATTYDGFFASIMVNFDALELFGASRAKADARPMTGAR